MADERGISALKTWIVLFFKCILLFVIYEHFDLDILNQPNLFSKREYTIYQHLFGKKIKCFLKTYEYDNFSL